MIMLDLCAGLQGASQAARERGWRTVTIDNNPALKPNIVADIRDGLSGPAWSFGYDLIWASPPCTEFSREFMPWCRTGKAPDLSIMLACKEIIDQLRPRYWVIENVVGAVRWFAPILGRYRTHYGPFYLWGNFPDIGKPPMRRRNKENMSSSWSQERGRIPPELSLAVIRACEIQAPLPLPTQGEA